MTRPSITCISMVLCLSAALVSRRSMDLALCVSMTIVWVSVDFLLPVFLDLVSRGYNNGPATVCVHDPPTLVVQDPGNMGVNNLGNMGVHDPGNMGVHNSGSMGVHDTGTMGVQSGGKSSVDTISVDQHCGQS